MEKHRENRNWIRIPMKVYKKHNSQNGAHE